MSRGGDGTRVTLKDGSWAVIRPVRLTDAAALLKMERAVTAAGVGTVLAPEQLPADAAAMRRQLRKWMEGGARDAEEGRMLVAVRNRSLVGQVEIRRHRPARVRHVARVSVGVRPDAQGLGVGRALMLGALGWARGSGVNVVSLSVFAENRRAVGLYTSLGFVVNGVRRRYLREADGREHDDLEMTIWLDESAGGAPESGRVGLPS